MPQVSIIVPAYNVEKYLRRCIDSILTQTFTDFELLLVDDGSTDSSGKICDEYKDKDDRIRVFHKENGGVSSARNLGIENARGEWVTFCDSDDFVSDSYLQDLCGWCETTDFIVSVYSNSKEKSTINKSFYIKESCLGNYIENIKDNLTWSVPWGKIYKRDIIENFNIRFERGIQSGEDSIFVLEYIKSVKNVTIIPFCGYYYAENNGLSKQELNLKEIDEVLNKLINNLECLEEKFDIRLKRWKINFIWNFITKYKIPKSFCVLYDDVKKISKKHYMILIVNDCEYVPKGVYRNLFDKLYKYRLYILLSYMIYTTKRFYK